MHKVALALMLLVANWPASAQHLHYNLRGPNGGPILQFAGVDAELLIDGRMVRVALFDEGAAAVNSKGFASAALVSSEQYRELVALSPDGKNSLKGESKEPIPARASILQSIKTPNGVTDRGRIEVDTNQSHIDRYRRTDSRLNLQSLEGPR